MKKSVILPEGHPVFGSNKVFDLFQYNPAVESNGLLFIAGQIGMCADGTIPEEVSEQCDLAFQRLGAILEARGLSFDDLVELTTYHVDIDSHLTSFREVKERYIKKDFPAWTILGVSALARPILKIEIKAVAAMKK